MSPAWEPHSSLKVFNPSSQSLLKRKKYAKMPNRNEAWWNICILAKVSYHRNDLSVTKCEKPHREILTGEKL